MWRAKGRKVYCNDLLKHSEFVADHNENTIKIAEQLENAKKEEE